MKIGFIWHCPYPWDVRLEKTMKALAEQGHRICLVSRGKRGLPREEHSKNFDIYRVMLTSSPRLHWGNQMAGYPLFFSPVWIHQTLRIMRREKVDLLFVRDLPLALMAGCLGKALKKPVILDMAENYPAALMAYKKLVYQPFLLGNGWLPRSYEKISLHMMDHTFVVAEEQRHRLERLGVSSEKISVVGNTPEQSFYSASGNGNGGRHSGGAASLNLLYVGYLDPHRGVELVVRAVPQLAAEFRNLQVTLIGDGTSRRPLKGLVNSLGLERTVELPGWVDFSKLPEHILRSTICLIPHLKSEHTETTLPNKLFDYMALGKPVVAADCAPIKRIINETGCGLTFRNGDVEDFRRVVRSLLLDPTRELKGLNGKRAVEEKYNWDVDKGVLVTTVQRMGTC